MGLIPPHRAGIGSGSRGACRLLSAANKPTSEHGTATVMLFLLVVLALLVYSGECEVIMNGRMQLVDFEKQLPDFAANHRLQVMSAL